MRKLIPGISVFIFSLAMATDTHQNVVKGELGKRLDAYLQAMEAIDFHGAVAVSQNGKVILNKGYGYADLKKKQKNDAATAFDTGSVTKQFTAAAVMLLEQEGKLNTADPITRYLKNVPPDKQSITLHQLLTHTAGITNYTGEGDYNTQSRAAMLKEALETDLNFKPGTEYRYSNTGYSMLAAIVEMVSGQDYERFVQKRLFDKAGVQYIGYTTPAWDKIKVSRQYDRGQDNGQPLEKEYCYWSLKGNGGMLALPGDMLRWMDTLHGKGLFTDAVKKKMFTADKRDYAYGWVVQDSPYGKIIHHNGGNDSGATANFTRFVDHNITIFYAVNHTTDVPHQMLLATTLDKVIFDKDFHIPTANPNQQTIAAGMWTGAHGSLEVRHLGKHTLILPIGDELVGRAIGATETERTKMKADTKRAGALLDEFLAGKSERFAALHKDQDRMQRRLDYLNRGKQRVGKIKDVRVYGSVPSWWNSVPNANNTIVTLIGEKEKVTFRYVWGYDNDFGIGGSVISFATGWFCQQGKDGNLQLIDMIYGKVMTLIPGKDGKSLTLQDGNWSSQYHYKP